MLRLKSLLLVAAAIFSSGLAQSIPEPTDKPGYIGCYELEQDYFKEEFSDIYMTNGLCREKCASKNSPLAAMTMENVCYCGQTMPGFKATKPSMCNAKCASWNEPCGSKTGDYITVWLTNKGVPKPRPQVSKTSTSSPGPTSGSETSAASTSDPASNGEKEEKKGISKAGAAAAAVVSILVAAAIAVGGFVLFRRRQRAKIEEEYRRTLAARDFTKKAELDHRLEPVMLQRRLSDGSIADNEDYSRRILKVTNPDG